MRHHAAIAWQYGVHAEAFHTGEDLFLQFLLTLVPGERQRSTPPFEVVHLPPGKEGRTGNKLTHLFLSISEFEKHVSPYALLTDDGQREVHPVERHPVDLLFPAFPVPEGHGVAEGTVVEVITQCEVCLVAFFL